MNGPATVPRWTKPVPQWTPSLDAEALEMVLAKVRGWKPFDGDTLLDDIAAVIDDVIPPEEEIEEHAQRLRGHLKQLIDIAVAAENARKDQEKDQKAARLIRQARTVRTEEIPGGHLQAVGHVRRMAWTANELLERLAAIKCLKEAA